MALRTLRTVLVFLCALAPACGGGGDDRSDGLLRIDTPSEDERTFAPTRDLYVAGSFDQSVTLPGDVRVEIFRRGDAAGSPVRSLRSHVDPATGTTPPSAIETNYPPMKNWGLSQGPDLVKEPGGFPATANKVLVTPTGFSALILGGVSKGFDTSYRGEDGGELEDLAEGDYTVIVTGLSGGITGATTRVDISFRPQAKILSRFKPAAHVQRLTEYAHTRGLRIYLDSLPGYLSQTAPDGSSISYEIPSRWRPNNAIEVAQAAVSAEGSNTFVLYNISETSTTQKLELGTVLYYGLLEDSTTSFMHYDDGEPVLTYVNDAGTMLWQEGKFVPFPRGSRLAARTPMRASKKACRRAQTKMA